MNARTTYTIVALIHPRPAVVYRAVSLCRRYRVEIDSVTVTLTEQDELSRMTLVVHGFPVTPLVAQLRKLIDLVEIQAVSRTEEGLMEQQPFSPPVIATTPPSSHTAQADGVA